MSDTQRTLAEILTLFEDNSSGDISPQDLRDFVVSVENTISVDTETMLGRVTAANGVVEELTVSQVRTLLALTDAGVKTAYENNADTNALTDLEKARITVAGIKTAYESNSDTNAYSDSEKAKLAGASYFPEYGATDQGVTGSNNTIKYYIDTYSSNNPTIKLRHNSGAATTTYTLTTSETIPAGVMLDLSDPGIRLDGAGTLTFAAGAFLKAGEGQCFGSSIDIVFNRIPYGSPAWWGSFPDGVESSAEFQRCVTAIEGAGNILLSTGTYLLNPSSPIEITDALTTKGVNSYTTKLSTSSATLSMFNVKSDNAVNWKDLQFTSSVTRSAGHFVHYEGASGGTQNRGSVCSRIVVNDAYIGLDFEDAYLYTVEDSYIVDYVSAGMIVENTVSPDTGDSSVKGNTFDGGTGSGTAILQKSSGGLKIKGNKFLNGDYHYKAEFDSSPNDTSILIISGNSMEKADTASIAFSGSGTTTFEMVEIIGNQITLDQAGSFGVSITDPSYTLLNGGIIGSNIFNLGDTATAIALTACDRITITPNSMVGNGTGEVGITTSSTVVGATIYPQDMNNVDTEYSIAGTVKWVGGFHAPNTETGTSVVLYDFAVDGGAIGDIIIGTLPDNAVITEDYYEIITAFTSGGSATVAISTSQVANEIVTATAFDNAVFNAGYHDGIQDGTVANFTTKTTAARNIILTIATADVTAGKFYLHYKYIVSE